MTPIEICAAAVIIVCLLLVVYFIFMKKPVSYTTSQKPEGTVVSIKANEDLPLIELVVKSNDEELRFRRSDVKKDETVVFNYPPSQEKARLIVHTKKKTKSYEL